MNDRVAASVREDEGQVPAVDRPEMPPGATRPLSELVELLARTGTIVTLALPAVGAAMRWLSYRLDGTIPTELAAAAPLPELAALAFAEVLPLFVIAGVTSLTVVGIIAGIAEEGGVRVLVTRLREKSARWTRRRQVAVLVGVTAVALWFIATLDIGSTYVSVAGAVLTALVFSGAALGEAKVRTSDWVLAAGLLLATAIVTAGAFPPPSRPVYVRVADSVPYPTEGWYDLIGSSGDVWYLRSCASQAAGTIAVDRSSVSVLEYSVASPERAPDVQVWELVRDAVLGGTTLRFGFASGCPAVETS